MDYKQCFVPTCTNDSIKNPDKMFVKIRNDLRKQWCEAANVNFFRICTYYCCDEHFDPEEDLKDFHTYKENKKRPMFKPTAKFRYINKLQPVIVSVKSEPALSPEKDPPEIQEVQPVLMERRAKKKVVGSKLPAKKAVPAVDMEDFSEACRCCLLSVGPMKPIFGSSLDIMLTDLMGVQIKRNDGYPQQVCIRCIRKLSSAHNFYQTVKNSHKTVEEKCGVARLVTFNEPNPECSNKTVESETMTIGSTRVYRSIDVSCQTEEKYFQKLMLANVQLYRVEQDSPTEMPDAEYEYVMLSENEDDMPETKYTVPVTYTLKCPQCLYEADGEDDLEVHMKTHVAAAEEGDEGTPEQLCNICGQTFKRRTSLYKHLRFHRGLCFECKYCDKQFAEYSTLRVHLIRHSLKNRKPFDCDSCERSFTQRASLNKHRRALHADATERSTMECPICQKQFLYKYSLQKHRLRHHTPIRCNECDSEHSGMLALQKHIKSHKDNREPVLEEEYLEFDEL